ncbi:MAG: hypothetical protein ACMXYE_01440 [Candidatus Woesearchaeota archaeon]
MKHIIEGIGKRLGDAWYVSMRDSRIHHPKFTLAMVIDVIFFVVLGFVLSAFLSKIYEYLQAVGTVAVSAEGLRSATEPSLLGIVINDQTIPYLINIGIMTLLLFVILYGLFVIFFGSSTYISMNLTSARTAGVEKHLMHFAYIMIPWGIILAIRELIAFYFAYIDQARATLGLEATVFSTVDTFFVVILVYLMLISFTLPSKKNFRRTLAKAWKEAHILFPIYGGILIVLFILGLLSTLFMQLNYILTLLFQVGVVAFIVYARVLFKNYSTHASAKPAKR